MKAHLCLVLGFLKDNQLYAKYSKCDFWISFVSFLGHIVSKKGVIKYLQNVKAVKNWARQINMIEIENFMGLASYYH